jgi:hypothetical protein
MFLLSGIAAILAVMSNRLSRIIDRARVLRTQLPGVPEDVTRSLHTERAWASCSCLSDISAPVALLLATERVTFFAGLVLFLREIFVATANLRIGPH